ncbi:MAG: methionine gamma-lyase [Alphaproteobacteria bacterium]|nr:methionine gamma-lyase [Alphaproteobacteria bacterium]
MAFDSTRPLGFATRAIHHGYNPADNANALTPPLHLSSTFAFPTAEEGGALFAGETEGHVYSRISNPTVALLESRIADLEGAEAGLCTGSGMGAISATMWTLLKPGDEIITDQTLYGCTFAFMRDGLSRFGITITHVDLRDPENLRGAISDKTRIVYFESPANPNMRLVDIRAVSSIAHEHDTLVVVDNTYASPMLTRPLTLGADFVLHSATKYLGGHGDLVAGAVCGRADAIHEIRMVGVKDMTGSVMAPFNAMLVMRGLKTLQLRMARHCESGMKVAEWLEAQPGVSVVHYPGLVSHPQHELAKRQMDGFGGMVAFELEGGYEAGLAMMNRLRLIRRAVSLGDAETLIQHPASMTHSTYSPDERRAHGISEGLVRLSVGLEDVTDLIEDLAGALGTNDR